MTKAQIRKNAFLKSIPIMCSYIFVSMAYGIMMEMPDLAGTIHCLSVLPYIPGHSSLF